MIRRECDHRGHGLRGTPSQPKDPDRCRHKVLKAIPLLLLATLVWSTALADDPQPRRPGKVIIIRGAFTVFSLGMNELGKKLSQQGLDVEVVADITARRAASKLKSKFERDKDIGPIVFIGHSRGAELGPKQARYLHRHGIPVKLVVMVDAVHQTSIPENVEKCVNLYHNGTLGLVHGVPADPESRKTKMLNVDIDRLRSRSQAGSINHFNIDSSSWIHDLVIAQVLKACPKAGSTSESPTAADLPLASGQNNVEITIRGRSSSGLLYPTRILTGLWAAPEPAATAVGSSSFNSSRRTGRPRSRSDPSASRARDKEHARGISENHATEGSRSSWSLGAVIDLHDLSKPRTVRRSETPKIQQLDSPDETASMPKLSEKGNEQETDSRKPREADAGNRTRSPASSQDSGSDEDSSSAAAREQAASEQKEKTQPRAEQTDNEKKSPPVQMKLSG